MITLRHRYCFARGDDALERIVLLDLIGVFDGDQLFVEAKLHQRVDGLPVDAVRELLAA